ncbi:MAG: CheR family methyltransferase, partial [Steroidobacteraceae bacterium]
MQLHLPEQLLSRLSERVATDMGLHFPRERWRELEAGVQSAADELGISDAASCAHRLLSAPLSREQVEILATGLTIGETYFFREDGSFKAIAGQILPELLRARRESGRRLRIWSAGCCTGEEPYSIAIMLERAIPDIADWQITLLATDVNPRFLRKAVDGTFGEWSFRDPPPWLKSTYFTSVAAHRYAISPRLRQRVSFAYLNLADEAYPSLATNTNAMDLIFCRNVLMYFPPAQAGCVVDRFHRSLAPQGWLVVGGADGTSQLLNEFAPTQFDGSVLYRKRPAPALPAAFAGSPLPDDSFLETAAAFGRIEVANATAGIADSPPAEAAIAQPNPHTQALALFGRGRYADARRMLESIAF